MPRTKRINKVHAPDELPEATFRWLLAGDPSIRWQALRDLAAVGKATWRREQERIGREGWGARLLSSQDGEGNWTPRVYGKKWISTFYSLLQLRELGLPARHPIALKACGQIVDQGPCEDGGLDLSVTGSASDVCVTGMALNCIAWFGWEDPRVEGLVDYLLREQMQDGGWNCRRPKGATHGSFHSTLSVLEGLSGFAATAAYKHAQVMRAGNLGREFLLRHQLYLSHRTGRIVDSRMLAFHFPPRWRYDVLRALDYFRDCGAAPEPRLEKAVLLLLEKRDGMGRLKLAAPHPGAQWFAMEKTGAPSRWNTLRAARVLKWWAGFIPAGQIISAAESM